MSEIEHSAPKDEIGETPISVSSSVYMWSRTVLYPYLDPYYSFRVRRSCVL